MFSKIKTNVELKENEDKNKRSQVQDKVTAIMRNFLDNEKYVTSLELEQIEDLTFYQIKGLTDFWNTYNTQNFNSLMGDIINGLFKYGMTFSYLIIGDKYKISLFIGVSNQIASLIDSSLNATYPYIEFSQHSAQDVSQQLKEISHFGGILTGSPTDKTIGISPSFQIEKLIKGMFGERWGYMVLAKALSPTQVFLSHQRLLVELNEVSRTLKHTTSGGALGNQVIENQNFTNQNYFNLLNILEQKINNGVARGMWRVCPYYMSDKSITNNKLKNLLKSTFSGEESALEPIRSIDFNDRNPLQNLSLIGNELPNITHHPLGVWEESPKFRVECFKYKYQSILTSDEVATLCQIPRQEVPGYYINPYVEFEVAERRKEGNFVIGDILNGNKLINNKYNMDIDDLTRHGLIIGITGGGKTNTSKSLLDTLWNTHKKPFLVIESAKREYWELNNLEGFEDLQIFTLGSEGKNSIPYRVNPFEVIGNVPLQTHIDYLLATFKASFELYPPMPYVLETAVYEVYEDKGWNVLEDINIYGRNDFPTLEDLYYKVETITNRLGYHQEVQSNVKAALQARINSLRIGGKGAMLDTRKSIPLEILLNKPVVMELEDIGDDEVKSFVIGIILVQLYEYRRSMVHQVKGLEHILLIEEAHRLLKNVSSAGGANPQVKAVEFFCNLLAEIRSYGQGILIADQIPTKLASDTLKNTNLKIVHRTVMEEDRFAVGKSMNMTSNQIDYLSALKRGCAAVYSEGDSRPKLVQMRLMKNKYSLSREEVVEKIKRKIKNELGEYQSKYSLTPACSYCINQCAVGTQIKDLIEKDNRHIQKLENYNQVLRKYRYKTTSINSCLENFENEHQLCLSLDMKICVLGYILKYGTLSEAEVREVILDFIKKNND